MAVRQERGSIVLSPGYRRRARRFRTGAERILRAIGDPPDLTFVRLRGNLGDHLIWEGTRRLLSHRQTREVAAEDLGSASGHTAVMSGGGGWCHPFHGLAPDTLPKLEALFRRVIVLPSTFDVSLELTRRTLGSTRAVVFARERASFEQIRSLCEADLAHDTAFYFDYRPHLRRGRGTLLAWRTDAEAAGPPPPEGNEDISLTHHSLESWLETIARHDAVETDRAHVMIAAAMLGKRVRYRPTIYHKVPAIAEYSLSSFDVAPAGAQTGP